MQVPRFFDAVEAVAQQLEKEKEKQLNRKKQLDGKRVEQIIRGHISDPAAVQLAMVQRLHQLL
jgi:hypothetical protein